MADKMREKILEAAERRARAGGYNGFSFRDLAEDVGIKSASIHYHFPTKASLAEALVRRYAARACGELGEAGSVGASEATRRVCNLFERALVADDKMCLCGLFGAERDALPPLVARATADFFRDLIAFLREAGDGERSDVSPEALVAALEGGLILARSLGDPAILRDIIDAQLRLTR
jgi:TetR/AcrR family transcriptional repressor of nem operon